MKGYYSLYNLSAFLIVVKDLFYLKQYCPTTYDIIAVLYCNVHKVTISDFDILSYIKSS